MQAGKVCTNEHTQHKQRESERDMSPMYLCSTSSNREREIAVINNHTTHSLFSDSLPENNALKSLLSPALFLTIAPSNPLAQINMYPSLIS